MDHLGKNRTTGTCWEHLRSSANTHLICKREHFTNSETLASRQRSNGKLIHHPAELRNCFKQLVVVHNGRLISVHMEHWASIVDWNHTPLTKVIWIAKQERHHRIIDSADMNLDGIVQVRATMVRKVLLEVFSRYHKAVCRFMKEPKVSLRHLETGKFQDFLGHDMCSVRPRYWEPVTGLILPYLTFVCRTKDLLLQTVHAQEHESLGSSKWKAKLMQLSNLFLDKVNKTTV